MSGNVLADTSAVLAFFNGCTKTTEIFNRAEVVYLPSIVVGELYVGLKKCSDPEREEAKITAMIARTEALSVNFQTGKYYAQIITQLEADGKRIPLNDVWIAALSIQHHCGLIARDAHFERVKGIDLRSIALSS